MISLIIPTNHNSLSSSFLNKNHQNKTIFFTNKRRKIIKKHNQVPVARLFGPAIFEASKLKVLFLGGVDEQKHNDEYLPRTYTLTHSDITSKLTLAISQTINTSQGWSNKLYRDEVVAEWRKVKGNMSLHVHCHISGGHFLLDLIASLRFSIFTKELPLVLKAIAYGDGNLLKNYPELEEASVWVYFHSNTQEFNKVECWGPLKDAVGPLSTSSSTSSGSTIVEGESAYLLLPCPEMYSGFYPYDLDSWGWSNKLYRDEVVAEWRKVKGNMSLHVHCHISGGHFLLDMFARLRFSIFTKELPLVLKAIAYGDGNLLKNYPELEEASVWVYFHSNTQEFNKVECWGPLKDAVGPLSTSSSTSSGSTIVEGESGNLEVPKPCLEDCSCCFPPMSSIPWSYDFVKNQDDDDGSLQNVSQQKD
ncbi:Staygreen protein [Artemisia annua]|uniref:Staygreen protein n=1 Tax=Artemisia annua TaxID=35608 RepID=A0A2U1MLT7_ARTAN|nr:Staygreen protein [Artemisia annua]